MYLTDKSTEENVILQQTKKKRLGQRQNKTEKVPSNTILEGFTISCLTGDRWGYQDWV